MLTRTAGRPLQKHQVGAKTSALRYFVHPLGEVERTHHCIMQKRFRHFADADSYTIQ